MLIDWRVKSEFERSLKDYCGMPINDDTIDTELVSHVIDSLKRGKAAGIDSLSAEHLLFCHPALSVVFAKLFQLMVLCCYVPNGLR